MIIDRMERIRFYSAVLPNLECALKAMASQEDKKIGRYEFRDETGKNAGYFMIQKGSTHPIEEGTFEAHRKYVDVQIMIEGSEEIAWNHLSDLTVVLEYDPEKDAERLQGKLDHVMRITEGMFYAAFPSDGHKAISHTKEEQNFTKIVLKLPI